MSLGQNLVRAALRDLDLGITVKQQLGTTVISSGIGGLVGYAENGYDGLLPGAAAGAALGAGVSAAPRAINRAIGTGKLPAGSTKQYKGTLTEYTVPVSDKTKGVVHISGIDPKTQVENFGRNASGVLKDAARDGNLRDELPYVKTDAQTEIRDIKQGSSGYVTMALEQAEDEALGLSQSKKLFSRTYDALEDHIIRHKLPSYTFSGMTGDHNKLYTQSLVRKGPPKGYVALVKYYSTTEGYPSQFQFVRKERWDRSKDEFERFGYEVFDKANAKARIADFASEQRRAKSEDTAAQRLWEQSRAEGQAEMLNAPAWDNARTAELDGAPPTGPEMEFEQVPYVPELPAPLPQVPAPQQESFEASIMRVLNSLNIPRE